MYTIGEFSKINRITPKTLRHYDKIGLLKPARIDDWTGYRYYSPEQLTVIHEILTLKDMGFNLDEIRDYLSPLSDLKQGLERREIEIRRAILREKDRLDRVKAYRRKLEGEEVMKESVIIKSLPKVTVASMRTVVPGYDTYFDIVPRMGEYMDSVGAACLEPAYCFNIYHDGEYRETDIDVEICEAVTEACEDSDKVKFKEIDGVEQAACLVHVGPYSTLRETYNKLFSWIDSEGWVADDNPRESYIDGIWNKGDTSEWRTEVQVPVNRKN